MKNLFVIGPARSGTTALLVALNQRKGVYLLSELNAALIDTFPEYSSEYDTGHFVKRYCARLAVTGDGGQGYGFTPEVFTLPNARSLLEYIFTRKLHGTGYAGEKIAVTWPKPQCDALVDYHLTHFRTARYILTLREPLQLLLSMMKLHPEREARDLVEEVAHGFRAVLRLLQELPHARLVIHDYLNDATVRSLDAWLGLESPPAPPSGWVSSDRKHHHRRDALPSPDFDTSGLDELQAIIAALKNAADPGGEPLALSPGEYAAIIGKARV